MLGVKTKFVRCITFFNPGDLTMRELEGLSYYGSSAQMQRRQEKQADRATMEDSGRETKR